MNAFLCFSGTSAGRFSNLCCKHISNSTTTMKMPHFVLGVPWLSSHLCFFYWCIFSLYVDRHICQHLAVPTSELFSMVVQFEMWFPPLMIVFEIYYNVALVTGYEFAPKQTRWHCCSRPSHCCPFRAIPMHSNSIFVGGKASTQPSACRPRNDSLIPLVLMHRCVHSESTNRRALYWNSHAVANVRWRDDIPNLSFDVRVS